MYLYIIEKLYEKNAQLLIESKNILKMTRSELDFRTPQELQSGYFIELHIDSNYKFRILKKLLVVFELEDELQIKYSDTEKGDLPNRFRVRKEFWKQLLPKLNETELFLNVNPTTDHWLGSGAGISGLQYVFVITGKYVRIELAILKSSKEKNKEIFKYLFNLKDTIELKFSNSLEWEELPENKMSRIKYQLNDVNLFDKADWEKISQFFVKYLPKFESAFSSEIKNLK